MNKILSVFVLVFVSAYGFGQCMVEPLTLQTRIQQSGDVLEGKVIMKKSYYNQDRSFIYTLNTLEVYRVFKGNISAKTIEVITDGGQIGNEMITAHPSLEFQLGNIGILMLRKGSYQLYSDNTPQFYMTSMNRQPMTICRLTCHSQRLYILKFKALQKKNCATSMR